MAPKLYGIPASPPVRAVYLFGKAVGVDFELVNINLLEKEQLSEEFLKLNPQHTVPTIVLEDGRSLWESHAILLYVVRKYNGGAYYPQDPFEEAVVQQRLHFNSNAFFQSLRAIARPIFHTGNKTIAPENLEELIQNYTYLEKFLEGHNWIAGNRTTIADYSIITTLSNASALVPVDPKRFPNITAWVKRCQQWPNFNSFNQQGVEEFKALLKW